MEQNQMNNDEIEIDLREIFSVLLSHLGIIILSGLVLGLVAIVGTKVFITPQYQSVTKMYVLAKQNNDTLTSADMQTSTLLTKDYAEMIQSRTVTEAVIAQLGLDMTHEQLVNKISVSNTTDTRIITISVLDKDPYMARDIANAVRDTAAEHIKNVMNSEAVNVVDEANIPAEKYSPSVSKNGLIGGVLGCMIAVAIILIRFIMNDTIQTAEDVERYAKICSDGKNKSEKFCKRTDSLSFQTGTSDRCDLLHQCKESEYYICRTGSAKSCRTVGKPSF